MPPVYSTPNNRRIDERVLASLRYRNLMSSMQNRLNEMGSVQSQYKSPQQVRLEYDRVAARERQPFRSMSSSKYMASGYSAYRTGGEDSFKYYAVFSVGSKDNVVKYDNKAEVVADSDDFRVIESTAVRKFVNNKYRRSSEPAAERGQLELSEVDSSHAEADRLFIYQERELDELRRKNADLIELFYQSHLLNEREVRDAAAQCDAHTYYVRSSYDIYEITQDDKYDGADAESAYNRSVAVSKRIAEQSEKLQLYQSQILELSQQLNKQKAYESQLIDELMKMQKMVYGDDFKEENARRDRELIQRNRYLEEYNQQLYRELASLRYSEHASEKYYKQKEKYSYLKAKYVDLQRRAQELDNILQNEQNETYVVIKELVYDIEDMKLRSYKKVQDE